MAARPSLQEYAEMHPSAGSGSQAWLPSLPEFDAICQGWLSGEVTQKQIRAWLIDVQGYSPKVCTVARIAWLTIYMPKRQNG